MRLLYVLVFSISVLLAGCSHHGEELSPLTGNTEVLTETARLITLANQATITTDDFSTLATLTETDHHAEDEVAEIQTMVKYGEFVHAGHGLAFLNTYIETGKHPICPGHSLAHYYVFTRHGETDLATDAFSEAKEQLPEWEAGMQTQLAEFPGPVDFETLRTSVRANIDAIENKQPVPSAAIVDQLAMLPCVEE